MNTRPLVAVEDLTVTVPGSRYPVVDGVSVTLHGGECVALIGESGSGKSLTAKALLGLLPSSATVSWRRFDLLDDPELTPEPGRRLRAWQRVRGRLMGFIPQDALGSLDPLRRVEHEVGDALRLHALARGTELRERVITALARAGVPEPEERMRDRSDQLSGGLRQRALLASAIIADPEVIIADEPTASLDAEHRGRVLAELRARCDRGAAALVITHDLQSVRGVADRILVMRAGRILEETPTERIFTAPQHPFTRELIAASSRGRKRSVSSVADTRSQAAERPRLELRSVSVSFGTGQRQRHVLHDVSLQVHPGETVGLVGASGSGKTTLLRVALGLLEPDTGAVLIDGTDRLRAVRAVRQELRQRIAFVPQDPLDSFPPGASGLHILRDALRAASVSKGKRTECAHALAEEVGLTASLLARPAAATSGGQRQRLAIARALARDPELLLLDEPVSALDTTVQARVLDLLNQVQATRGTAFLLVSHDRDVVRRMSDRVVSIENGRLEESE